MTVLVQALGLLILGTWCTSAALPREIPTREEATGLSSSATRGAYPSGAESTFDDDDDAPRGSKRELGDVSYHGHGHGHATSYQNFVLHSYHPKKVIYHKKHGHGHHHSPVPAAPAPHHSPAAYQYDEGAPEDASYPLY